MSSMHTSTLLSILLSVGAIAILLFIGLLLRSCPPKTTPTASTAQRVSLRAAVPPDVVQLPNADVLCAILERLRASGKLSIAPFFSMTVEDGLIHQDSEKLDSGALMSSFARGDGGAFSAATRIETVVSKEDVAAFVNVGRTIARWLNERGRGDEARLIFSLHAKKSRTATNFHHDGENTTFIGFVYFQQESAKVGQAVTRTRIRKAAQARQTDVDVKSCELLMVDNENYEHRTPPDTLSSDQTAFLRIFVQQPPLTQEEAL